MVQTDDQYVFIHDAVLDATQSGSTEVPSSKLTQHVQVLQHPQRQMDDATGFKIEFDTGKSRTVRQFQFTYWPDWAFRSQQRILDYVGQLHQTKVQFGSKGPICVHCSEGAGPTGVFIAVSTVIERIKQERVVDIFTAVKLLRMQRQKMVETREQYEFCYTAAIEFLNSYDDS
ncbi:protein-tyrosine phosphatase domain-containing protein [Ditylenchus destructor]|nr:protein-tyrosine phosphatase domain-containing protein [Ditylenchus destructor]